MKNTSIHKHIRSAASFLAKTFLGFVILIPILVSLSYSLRPDTEIMNMSMSLLPERWTLEHYRWLFRYIPMTRYIINSFICCAIVIVCQTVCASLAAYAFAFFEFPFKKALFTAVLVTTMIPGDVIIITNFLNIQRWNLTDTYLGLVFPFLISGISIFMMRQFYLSLPKELKEAATIDGCGDMAFLLRIAVPLSVPALISLGIYQFIGIYNQYLWPLLVTNTDAFRTTQIGMSMLIGHESDEVGRLLAGAVICIIPPMIVFVIGQKYLIRGMVSGSIKG